MIKHTRNYRKSHALNIDQYDEVSTTEKGLRQHQKMKHNRQLVDKLENLFKCGTCDRKALLKKASAITTNTTTTSKH